MKSTYLNLGNGIVMTEFSEKFLYMHKTRMDKISLPAGFEHYFETIDATLSKVRNRNDVCYITIDEKHLSPGQTHRRPGIHVDLNWFEGKGHDVGHKKESMNTGGLLLVSNYAGCQVYRGEFEDKIGEGGCCRLVDVSNLETEIMQPNHVFFLNAFGIHEGLPIEEEVRRTLIRINFHPDYVFQI